MLAFCVLLCAQWTLAAHACPIIQAAGETLEMQALLAEGHTAPCHQGPVGDGGNPAHCVGADQVSGSSLVLPAMPAPALVLRVPAVDTCSTSVALAASAHADATAPPLIILYCVLLA